MSLLSSKTTPGCEYCGLSQSLLSSLDEPLHNTSLTFSPDDIAAAKASVAPLQETIHRLEETIDRLKQLKGTKARAEARLAEQLRFLAPVRRLSDDDLLLIMETACEVEDCAHGHHFYEGKIQDLHPKKQTPWSISAVSRRWRTLALSTPQLWTRLDYTSSYEPTKNLERLRTSLQIERSKDRPLAVLVAGLDASEKTFHDLINDALKLQVQRLQTLDIRFHESDEIDQAHPLNLASLQRLRISGPCSDQVKFHDTPSLKHLFLEYVDFTRNILATDYWSALVSLQLENCFLPQNRDLLQVLRSARNLCLLKIALEEEDDSDPDPFDGENRIILFHHLKSFHISFHCRDYFSSALLRVMRTPSLTHLEIAHPNEAGLQEIPSLINSSGDGANPCLATLTLLYPWQSYYSEHDSRQALHVCLINLVQKLPSLQRLQIRREDSSLAELDLNPLFLALASPTGVDDTHCCPNLQELHIGSDSFNEDPPSLSPRSVRAFCDGRRALAKASSTRFATVFLSEGILCLGDGSQEDDGDSLRWVEEAQESGLLKCPAPKGSWMDVF